MYRKGSVIRRVLTGMLTAAFIMASAQEYAFASQPYNDEDAYGEEYENEAAGGEYETAVITTEDDENEAVETLTADIEKAGTDIAENAPEAYESEDSELTEAGSAEDDLLAEGDPSAEADTGADAYDSLLEDRSTTVSFDAEVNNICGRYANPFTINISGSGVTESDSSYTVSADSDIVVTITSENEGDFDNYSGKLSFSYGSGDNKNSERVSVPDGLTKTDDKTYTYTISKEWVNAAIDASEEIDISVWLMRYSYNVCFDEGDARAYHYIEGQGPDDRPFGYTDDNGELHANNPIDIATDFSFIIRDVPEGCEVTSVKYYKTDQEYNKLSGSKEESLSFATETVEGITYNYYTIPADKVSNMRILIELTKETEYCTDGKVTLTINEAGFTNVAWNEGEIGTRECTLSLYEKNDSGSDYMKKEWVYNFTNSDPGNVWWIFVSEDKKSWWSNWTYKYITRESGTYYATLEIKDKTSYNGKIYKSNEFVYTEPGAKLDAPEVNSFGVVERGGNGWGRYLHWDDIDNSDGYCAGYEFEATANGKESNFMLGYPSDGFGYCLDNMYSYLGTGQWNIKIRAISNNINSKSAGDWAEYTYDMKKQVTAEKLTMSSSALTLYTGEGSDSSADLTAAITPNNTTMTGISWKSSNEKVAKVDVNDDFTATVTAVGNGTATITATTYDSARKSATCKVTVKTHATGVTVAYPKSGGTDITRVKTGGTLKLTASLTPAGAEAETVYWKSSDSTIATVDQTGKVTGKRAGNADITSYLAGGLTDENLRAVTFVTVYQPITSISLPKTMTISEGGSTTLVPTLAPEDATLADSGITWESSNTDIATVDNSGKVEIQSLDSQYSDVKVTITATTKDSNGLEKKASTTITVKPLVKSVTLNAEAVYLNLGKTYTLKPTVTPANVQSRAVTYSSSDEAVATVTNKGVIKAVGNGQATITVKSADGSSAPGATTTCTVNVKTPMTKAALDKTSLTLGTGGSAALTLTVSPESVSSPAVTWTTNKEDIVSITDEGEFSADGKKTVTVVAGANPGKVKLTGTVTSSGYDAKGNVTQIKKTVTCNITVGNPVTELTLKNGKEPVTDVSTISLEAGKSLSIKAAVNADASNKNINWSSSDNGVATVNKGTVKAIGDGEATITAEATDGSGVKATFKVKVNAPVTAVKLSSTKLSLAAEARATVKANLTPVKPTAGYVIKWTVPENSNFVIVSEGLEVRELTGTTEVTLKGKGTSGSSKLTCTITSTNDRTYTQTCNVTGTNSVGYVDITQGKTIVRGTPQKLAVNKSASFTAVTYTDSDKKTKAANKTVTWTSSDESVATVKNGKVTATGKEGEVTITATSTEIPSSDPAVSAFFTIRTYIPATKVEINTAGADGARRTKYTASSVTEKEPYTNKFTLTAVVTTNSVNSDAKSVIWSSDKPLIASVDDNGTVTPLKTGKAVITATAADGSKKSAKCTVTVLGKVEGIKLKAPASGVFDEDSAITVSLKATGKAQTVKLTPVLNPTDASDKSVTYVSSNTSVATVNAKTGQISVLKTAKNGDSATITATTSDGGYTATCTVNINE